MTASVRISAAEAAALLAKPKKRGRFGVVEKSRRTLDGIVFASERETNRYAELKQMERTGMIRNLELQPEFPVFLNGVKLCTFTADFRYFTTSGGCVIEDAKTTGTQKDGAYRLRKRACEIYYNIKITEVVA
jgi:hypothetical protein